MFLQKYKYSPEFKLKVIEEYINNKEETLLSISQKFGIHYQTVYKWVYKYKKEGRKGFFINYITPWNKICKEKEREIVMLKERYPNLSVRRAQHLLLQKGKKISLKAIWRVWKRHGMGKRSFKDPFLPPLDEDKETQEKLNYVKYLLRIGNVEKSLEIINSLPSLPLDPFLLKLPINRLSPQKQLNLFPLFFTKLPPLIALKKIKEIRKKLKKQKLFYSLLIADLFYINLERKLSKIENVIKRIKKILPQISDSSIKFLILSTESILKANAMKIKECRKNLRECKRLAVQHPSAYSLTTIALIHISLDEFTTALTWLRKALHYAEKDREKKAIMLLIAFCYAQMGIIKKSKIFLKEINCKNLSSFNFLIYLYTLSLIKFQEGQLFKSVDIIKKALKTSKENTLLNYIHLFTLNQACIYALLNRNKEAQETLKLNIEIFRKENPRNFYLRKVLLKENHTFISSKKVPHSIRIALLLAEAEKREDYKKYKKAFDYAQKTGLVNFFYRIAGFFPKITSVGIQKKELNFPAKLLRFPAFDTLRILYHVEFLKNIRIYKNGKPIKIQLFPKEFSFLIYLSFKLKQPGDKVPLEEICSIFYGNSKNPKKYFFKTLSHLRKALSIPHYILETSHIRGNHCLINKGINFTNDYEDAIFTLEYAEALLRKGEWNLSKKEFLEVLSTYFIHEPLKRMFDLFSLELRMKIKQILIRKIKLFYKKSLEYNDKEMHLNILKWIKKTKVISIQELLI